MCCGPCRIRERALDEWLRVLRPGGRLAIIDGAQYNDATAPPQRENARTSPEYAAIGDQLPFYGGRPREEIEALLRARGLGECRRATRWRTSSPPMFARLSEAGKPAPRRSAMPPGATSRADGGKHDDYETILVEIEDGVGIDHAEPARQAQRDEPAAVQRGAATR